LPPREVFVPKPHSDLRNSERGCQRPVPPKHGNPVGLIGGWATSAGEA
jgi:hypothetical protein